MKDKIVNFFNSYGKIADSLAASYYGVPVKKKGKKKKQEETYNDDIRELSAF